MSGRPGAPRAKAATPKAATPVLTPRGSTPRLPPRGSTSGSTPDPKAATPVLTPRGSTPRVGQIASLTVLPVAAPPVDLNAAARAAARGRPRSVSATTASVGMPKSAGRAPRRVEAASAALQGRPSAVERTGDIVEVSNDLHAQHIQSLDHIHLAPGSQAERDRNRQMLHEVGESHTRLIGDFSAFKEAVMSQQTQHELTISTQMAFMTQAFEAAKEERHGNRVAIQEQTQQAISLHQKLLADIDSARCERQALRTEVATAHATFKQEVETLGLAKDAIQRDLDTHHQKHQEHHKEITLIKSTFMTREEEIKAHRKQMQEHGSLISKLQSGPKALAEELRRHQQQVQEHGSLISKLQDGPKALSEELRRHQQQVQEHSQQITRLQSGPQALSEELKAHQRKVQEHAEQITRLQSGPQALSEELKAHQRKVQEHQEMINTIRDGTKQREHELEDHKKKMQEHRQEITKLRETADEKTGKLNRKYEEHQQEIERLRETADEKTGKLNRKYEEHQQEISRLKEGVRTGDAFESLKSLVELTSLEFQDTKKQLLDKGVLGREVEKPPEDEDQPVGTITLGEDIFTTRLLLKLGMRKGRYAELEEARELDDEAFPDQELSTLIPFDRSCRSLTQTSVDEDGYSLSDNSQRERSELSVSEEMRAVFHHVLGLSVPEVEDGGWAHFSITAGWLTVCILTLFLQLVILAVLLHTYMMTEPCVKEQLEGKAWWLLHVSRCAAMVVAGGLMTKELMDVMNYFMVSELLEPLSCEVLITTFLRVFMIGVVAAANVFLFMSSTSPADVWMNMTALGFVSTLGQDMLEISKRGVFGHHIAQAVGDVSFQLNFLSEYPGWFSKMKNLTLFLAIIGVVGFSVFMFLDEDPICPLTPEEQMLGRHHRHHAGSGGGGGGGGGGGAHRR